VNHHSQSLFKIWSQRVGDCVQCGLHESAKTICLLGDGPVPCEGVILGEAPGGTEDENEIPFCGKSGLFLRRMLKEIGLDPKSLYFTNVVHCRPPANRTPTRKEIKICALLYLQKELDKVKPKVILLLGNTALSWALGRKAAITKAEGSTFSLNGYTCVPSRHPSSVVRMEDDPTLRKDFLFAQQKFRENLLLFKRTLNPPKEEFIYEKNLRLVKEADADVPIYGDIETNGLNFAKPDAKIHCISVCRIPGRVAAVRMTDENVLITKEMLLKHPIMVQRGTFEGTWFLWHFGILPRIYHDTKLGAFVQDETDNTGLKYQAIKCLGVEPWSEEQDWENPDYGKLLPYNARDSQYGLRLYRERDLPFLKRNPKVARLLRYILLPAEEVFTKVICRGAHINMEDAKAKLAIVEAEEEKIQKKINKIAGKEVNIGSPKQMSKLLYDQLKLECPVKTSKGAKSTSEAALIRLRGLHPITDLLWDWRGWNKKKTTYLLPWMKRGPILHFNYGFTDTVTGRLNSTAVKDKRYEKKLGATIHQCPREGFIRNLFSPRGYSTPPWEIIREMAYALAKKKKPKPIHAYPEDWCFVAADLSQVELRLVAHASGDKVMTEVFNKDPNTPEGDIHYTTARTLQTTGEIIKETRKKAKAVNFGFVYGMKWRKFGAYALEKFDLKLTDQDSKDYRRKFFKKYSGLEPWHRRVEAFVTENGWIDSVFGRRRHLPQAMHPETEECEDCHGENDDCFLCGGAGYVTTGTGSDEEWVRWEAIREAINSPIQSAGSDLQLFIAALIDSLSLPWEFKVDNEKAFMVGSAHDSQLFECHKSYAKELKEGIEYTVSQLPRLTSSHFGFTFRVPIFMDVIAYSDFWEGKVMEI
jgi:uracil-DNA glycosylase family 4